MRIKVYAAGGMKSDWQAALYTIDGIQVLNPCNHHLRDTFDYTAADLFLIRQADVVFAYWENDNPGGYNLSFEMGYAKALGKLIIYVCDKPLSSLKYSRMQAIAADFDTNSFEEGLVKLRAIVDCCE